ncbi:MAG: hypothetical protein ABL999_10980 [Pyrinomonadaceae bacterium]
MYTRIRIVGIFLSLIFSVLAITAQTAPDKSSYTGYKGLLIGATVTDVRNKLGVPKEKTDTMDLFVVSEMESVQFYYNADQTVTAIMMTYSGDLKLAPTPMDIFGEDVAPNAEGGAFKMVRYPKSGFWISYNRTPGSDAVVCIAIQKIL